MIKAEEALGREFAAMRSGRASASMLDKIQVEAYGSNVALNTVAQVIVRDAQALTVNVFDPTLSGSVERAVRAADMGLQATSDPGQGIVRVSVPKLNGELRQDLARQAAKLGEAARVRLRAVRKEALDEVKAAEKAKTVGKDEAKAREKLVQTAVDKQMDSIGALIKAKEMEILES